MQAIKMAEGVVAGVAARARAAAERAAEAYDNTTNWDSRIEDLMDKVPSPTAPVGRSPLGRNVQTYMADAREGTLLQPWRRPTKATDPLLSRFYANTVNEQLGKWDKTLQRVVPAYKGPVVLNPLAKGSYKTWGRLNEARKHVGDPARTQADIDQAARTSIQNRMRTELGRATTDRTKLDMGDPSDRIRAGPDFLHRNPIFHDYKPKTVWGMQPSTINGLVNMAGRAIGLPNLTQPYSSRMPSLYPAGNANYPVSDMDLLGMGEYMHTLGGPSRKTTDLAGAAAQYIR